ncbi:hypothetical protein IJ541_05105 [bacterium]|nr:hypothetical protein [bacterium]
MSLGTPTLHTHSAKVGTCPHGLPLGACPICNGMAGGNSTTKRDIPRNVGEMTYNQCAAIGAMLRAQKNARAQAQAAQQNHLQALADFQKNIANTHQRLMEFAQIINNSMPPIIAKPVNFILNNIIGSVLNIIQNIPNVITNISQAITQKLSDISDKLTAIYGELKASINEKVGKFVSNIKKKLKSMFFIFGTDETNDEEKKIDEAKRTFELKTFIHKLAQKLKNQTEKETQTDEHQSVK